MANFDKKTSQLPAAIEMTEDDAWAGVQGGEDKKFTPGVLRSLLGLPRAVANLTAAASLVAIIAAGADVRCNRGATLTLSSVAHRLTQPVGGTLDLNGSKLLFGYSDTSNSTNFNATDVRNGVVEIGAGCNIHRLMRFAQDGGRLDDVTVQSVDFIVNTNDTNDAVIRVEGNGFSSSNLTLRNMRNGCMVLGQDACFKNLKAYGMTKALIGNGGSAVVDVLTFDGTGSVSTTDPGHNAIGGNWKYLRVNKFDVSVMGEHGIYLAGDGKDANQFVSLTNGYIARSGQCSLKIKDYTRVHALGIDAAYTSYGNTPGLNEEGFRFQRNGLVTGGALNITKELVNGVPTGNAGWAHMFFSANDVVELLVESFAEGSGRGVYIGVDDKDPLLPHGRITVRVRHKDLGGATVEVADNAIINDVITVYSNVDGCPGAPVIIGAGVTFGPNGKIRVIGTYRNCGAAPPVSTANIDLSQFLPADLPGIQMVPSDPAPVATVLGDVSNQTLKTITIPPMGPRDKLEVYTLWSYPSSANTKTLRWSLGGWGVMSVADTTNVRRSDLRMLSNRGVTNSQVASSSGNAAGISVGTSAPSFPAVETKNGTTIVISAQPSSAAEQITLEDHWVRIMRGGAG